MPTSRGDPTLEARTNAPREPVIREHPRHKPPPGPALSDTDGSTPTEITGLTSPSHSTAAAARFQCPDWMPRDQTPPVPVSTEATKTNDALGVGSA